MKRRGLLTSAIAGGVVPAMAQSADPPLQFMFVQLAEGMRSDGGMLRLIGVSPQTVFFTDRPARIAGHLTMAGYMEEWSARAGPDNFANDPPNASLSVYEPGRVENSLVVLRISHPVLEGRDLTYRTRVIDGAMPQAGGATSLFIDWIGAGGGVGAGFHGVGRGARGVGWR